MFYIATAKGFVVLPNQGPGKKQQYLFVIDAREASPFVTFEDADLEAKACVQICFPRKFQYFAIMDSSNGVSLKAEADVIDVDAIELREVSGLARLGSAVKKLLG